MKKYSPTDFRRALTSNALDDQLILQGMAKAHEHDESVLLFSAVGCERWTPIPLELVLEVEHLGRTACKDHEHPLVRIHLKHPESPEARMLADLLINHMMVPKSSHAPRTPMCEKNCAACQRCDDPGCEECQICAWCSSTIETRRDSRAHPVMTDYEDCQIACGSDYQSCIESCDPRDRGCFYGCKRQLPRCLNRCR